MNRLLCANFSRLWKSKYFYIGVGVMFAYIALYMGNRCRITFADLTYQETNLESCYFQFSLVIGLFSAVFSTLFLGQEYSGGAIRNKVIAGYSRKDIYLSQLIVVSAASLLMLLAGMAGGLVGIPVFGFWKMGAGQLFLYLLIAAMSTLVFCAVNTYINVLTQNKVRSAVLTILVFFALLFLVSKLQARLDEPDTVFSDIQIHGDEINFLDPMPNPRYVSGAKREILDFIVDVLPTGQGLRLASNEAAHPVRMLLSSAVLTVLVTFGGIFRYGREDLK